MRLTIAAVGRMKAGPERTLLERYADRVSHAGKPLSLVLDLREVMESRARDEATRRNQEAAALAASIAAGARIVALDARGRNLDSRDFAECIARERDAGTTDLAFVIGGADGLGSAILERASLRLAFGAMTWPHQMARLMLVEQIYRATMILSGHPYHRD